MNDAHVSELSAILFSAGRWLAAAPPDERRELLSLIARHVPSLCALVANPDHLPDGFTPAQFSHLAEHLAALDAADAARRRAEYDRQRAFDLAAEHERFVKHVTLRE